MERLRRHFLLPEEDEELPEELLDESLSSEDEEEEDELLLGDEDEEELGLELELSSSSLELEEESEEVLLLLLPPLKLWSSIQFKVSAVKGPTDRPEWSVFMIVSFESESPNFSISAWVDSAPEGGTVESEDPAKARTGSFLSAT